MIGYTGWAIPEGNVIQVADAAGNVLWSANKSAVLEVEKITSNTYAGETTYENEEFILLDIYPKTNGTVSVTYGGLTKTITDTSGAAEPNAQQVFFGTFNGVSDSVTTPVSGTLTIEGDYRGVGCGSFSDSKITTGYRCTCITNVIDWGKVEFIPDSAFGDLLGSGCTKITSITIPSSIKSIGSGAFCKCTGLTSITIPSSIKSIGSGAFYGCTGLSSVTIPSSVASIETMTFYGCTGLSSVTIPSSVASIETVTFVGCTALKNIVVDEGNQHYAASGGILFNKEKTELVCYPSVSGHYTIPSSVTSISVGAFRRSYLTSVTIPSSVTSIGTSAFTACDNLTSVTFENKTGWYVTETESGDVSTGTVVDVTDAAANVTLITDTYESHHWYRTA